MEKKIVIALGGNAILRPGQKGTYSEQMENVVESCKYIAELVLKGYKVILTHGNGPQVGNILKQNEEAKDKVPSMPLDVCSAESQGFIGYLFETALKNELKKLQLENNVVTLITQTEVDRDDSAFKNPTKPIGEFYTEDESEVLKVEKQYIMKEDAGRGYRRVVASPKPIKIHGTEDIKTLMANETIVISTGGGGIPVYRDIEGQLIGVEAVIDKDRSAQKLAEELDADIFMIITDVSNAYINYGKENEKKLENISVSEAEKHLKENHFAVGSMGPKMESIIEFTKNSGKTGVICSIENSLEASNGLKGTRIY